MKVAFFIQEISCTSGKSDGVRNQAWAWAEGLRQLGVDIHLASPWDTDNFYEYDVVHMFGFYPGIERDLRYLKGKFKAKIAISPIIDTNRPYRITKLASWLHCPKLRMYSALGGLRKGVALVDGWFSRSEYEGNYIKNAFNVPSNKVFKVMLPTRLPAVEGNGQREDFCLIVSYLPSARKNIWRLIDAAIKYKFKLVLAGAKVNSEQFDKMMQVVKGHDNIKVVGYLQDDELVKLYQRARVFALPSTLEGVGLVALEAAANGCDVALTSWGAPKEYYNGLVKLVDPLSVDSIGKAICEFMDGDTYQPALREYIAKHNSIKASSKNLLNAYTAMLSDGIRREEI